MSFRILIISSMLGVWLSLFPKLADSQNKKITGVEIEGKLRLDEGKLKGATIGVYHAGNNELEQQVPVDDTGKFGVRLSFQHEYYLIFKNDGCYPKKLVLTTVIPEKVLKRDPYFPPIKVIVTLFREIPEIDPSFSAKPVGKIFYSAKLDNFDSESYFNDMQIREKIAEEVTVTYQKKLEVARTYEENGNLADAVTEYKRAAGLKNEDDFTRGKIATLEEQIKHKTELALQAEKARIDSVNRQIAQQTAEAALDSFSKTTTAERENVGTAQTDPTPAPSVHQELTAQDVPSDSTAAPAQEKIHPDAVPEDHPTQASTAPVKNGEKRITEEVVREEIAESPKPVDTTALKTGDGSLPVKASITPGDSSLSRYILMLVAGALLLLLVILLLFRRKRKNDGTESGNEADHHSTW